MQRAADREPETGLKGQAQPPLPMLENLKVVQRVPVRIRLKPEELAENPLSVGVSMRVRVDTRAD